MRTERNAANWITVEDMRRSLSIGKSKAYELLESEEIDAVRIGRTVRVSRNSLEQWIKSHPYKKVTQ